MFLKYGFGKVGVTVALIGTILVNVLVNLLMVNGKSTEDVIHEVSVYFIPASYTFLIWGLIYVSLTVFVIYQWLDRAPQVALQHLRPWFILSCLAHCVWIIFWHYDLIMYTTLEMIVLLVAVIMLYREIHHHLPKLTRQQWWCVQFPVSLYLGWISVATISNITIALYIIGWNGLALPGVVWAVVMVLLTSLLALWFIIAKHDYIFGLVVIWSLIGIAWNFPNQPLLVASILISLGLQLCAGLWLMLRPPARR